MEYDSWSCPRCSLESKLGDLLEAEVATADASRAAGEAVQVALDEQTRHLEWALQDATERQQANVANAWKLQADSNIDRACQLERAGLFQEALHHATIGLGLDHGNLGGHLVAGRLLSRLGSPAESRDHLLKACRLLTTPPYNAPRWCEAVLRSTPAGASDIEKAVLSIIQSESSAWHDSLELRGLITHLHDHGLDQIAVQLGCTVAGRGQSLLSAACRSVGNQSECSAVKTWLSGISVDRRRELEREITQLKEFPPVVTGAILPSVKDLVGERYREWQADIDTALQRRAVQEAVPAVVRRYPFLTGVAGGFAILCVLTVVLNVAFEALGVPRAVQERIGGAAGAITLLSGFAIWAWATARAERETDVLESDAVASKLKALREEEEAFYNRCIAALA